MSKKKVIGTCSICGMEGPLSAEHVPPKAAFNDKRVITIKFEDAINLGPDELIRGTYEQGGVKAYTLCGQCNNNTGAWYAKWFIDWCYQAAEILARSGGKPSLIYMYHAFPLRILKQIVTMFFAISASNFAKRNPDLVDFVLYKERKYLPPQYRFFVYYNAEGRLRYSSGVATLNTDTGRRCLFSETTFPPFGYVMTIDSEPTDRRLFEITHFCHYGYSEYEYLKLYPPVLPTHLALPGDYRTKAEIYRDAELGEGVMANNQILFGRDGDQSKSQS